jgi:hypothetical protein
MPVAGTTLRMAIPCKPDREARPVELGGAKVELRMFHCVAGGVSFALGHAHLADPTRVPAVLLQWRRATLQGLQVRAATEAAFVPAQASALAGSVRVVVTGSRADGSPLQLQAAWFARGTDVFQGLVYGPELSPALADPFFAGLRFP